MARRLRFLLSIDRPTPLAYADILRSPGPSWRRPQGSVHAASARPRRAVTFRATSRALTLDSELRGRRRLPVHAAGDPDHPDLLRRAGRDVAGAEPVPLEPGLA